MIKQSKEFDRKGGKHMKRILSFVCMLLCAVMLFSSVPSAAIAEAANVTRYLEINATNFPDKNFRNWIINHLDHKGTKSGGYYMTKTQVGDVTYIGCESCKIANLKGIEHFINLEYLYCGGNKLTALDVSKNTALFCLGCGYGFDDDGNMLHNSIESLDLTKNTELEMLDADGNKLKSLDLSKNTKLAELLISNNQLTALDVSKCKYLSALYCSTNQLSSLKLGSKPELETLHCSENALTSLDVSNAPALKQLDCWRNKLSSLNVSKNTKLDYLSCDDNRLTGLDVSKNLKLTQLFCTYNRLGALDVSKNKKLQYFDASFQRPTAKNGAKYNGTYQFDMKLLVPMDLMSRVTIVGNHTLNPVTGIVTLDGAETTLLYYMDPLSPNEATMDVMVDLSYVTQKKPAISTQPSNQTVAVGRTATFSVKASGGTLSYRWYYKAPNTSSWKAISAASGKTSKYTLTVEERHNGYQYKCVIKNLAGKVTSSIVTLKTGYAPEITTQPTNKTVAIGKTATFKVAASGTSLRYQWYYRTSSSGTWATIKAESGKTATYKVTVAAKHNGYQYRCKVKNAFGYVYTNTVTLKTGG